MSVTLTNLPDEAQLKAWGIPLAMAPHAVLPALTEEMAGQLGPRDTLEYLKRRHKSLFLEREEPLDHGWLLPLWKRIGQDVEEMRALGHDVIVMCVLGGNRGGKSKGAARLVNKILRDKPGARALHLHSKQDIARQTTMPYLYETIPAAWRPAAGKPTTGRHAVHRVSYTQGTGFADDVYVFPNGSQCNFGYYGNDLSTVEGPEYDVIWADELIPLKWVKTLRFRLATRRGLFIITFTPVDGVTPTVSHFVTGAVPIARSPLMPPDRLIWEGEAIGRHAQELPLYGADGELLGYGRMEENGAGMKVPMGLPRIEQCLDPSSRIYYAWTADNLYNPYESTARLARPGGVEEIKTRLYGLATAIAGVRIKLTAAHILPRDRVSLIPRTGRWYVICDPCEGRTWVILWIYVVGRQGYVLREFPCPGVRPFAPDFMDQQEAMKHPGIMEAGKWVSLDPPGESKKVLIDGYRGPAQKALAQNGLSWGLAQYRDEILRIERELYRLINPETPPDSPLKIVPFVRIMDSRAGNSPTMATSEATTMIIQMATLPGGEPLYFAPAPGGPVEDGMRLLDDWLSYDTTRPVDALNAPRLMVHESCINLRECLGVWTGADGQKGAAKDFADALGYFAKACPAIADHATAPEEGEGW